jgi:hypothetical protein
MFAALLVAAFATLTIPSIAGAAFLVAMPLAALATAWLVTRAHASDLKLADLTPRSFLVSFVVTVVLAVLFDMTAFELGIESTNLIGRSSLGGLTFGCAFAIGQNIGLVLERRRRQLGTPAA